MDQALKFDESVCESSLILFLVFPEDILLKRLMKRGETSGRDDDNAESIKKRFDTFINTSMPIVDYYRSKTSSRVLLPFYPHKNSPFISSWILLEGGGRAGVSFFGVIFAAMIAERWGRKWGFHFCEAAMILGAISGACSVNITMLILSRFFVGVGAWRFVLCAVLYSQEIAPATRRGLMGGEVGVALSFGYIIASWTDKSIRLQIPFKHLQLTPLNFYPLRVGFFYYHTKVKWRVPLAMQVIFPVFTFAASFFVPESPRYLCSVGRQEEALEVLKWIHADPADPENLLPREEHLQICKQVAVDRTLPSSWISMFTKYKRRTWTAILVAAARQASGVQVITNYGPNLYASLGYSAAMTLIVAAAWQTFGILMNATAALIVDRNGLRIILIFASVGTAVCMAGEAVAIACYQMGEPIQYVYYGEVFPTNVRPKGIAISIMIICLMSIWISEATPQATITMKWGFYVLFTGISLIGAILQYFILPETKNVRLEEMAALFGDEASVAIRAGELHAELLRMGVDLNSLYSSTPGKSV